MPRELREARRCRARCRVSKAPCGQPAMRDRAVCRMHGGKAGRPPIHGRYTKAAIAERRAFRDTLRLLRELVDSSG